MKNLLVAYVFTVAHLNIEFRRVSNENRWKTRLQLVQRLMRVNITTEEDRFIWTLTTLESFTVKSMYADMMNCKNTSRQ
jgi:hypothetical protein